MNVSVRHMLDLAAVRAEQTVQILIPLVALALFAALLRPQVCDRLGRGGTLTALACALLAAPAAVYAAARM